MKTTDIAGLMEKHRYREYLNRLDAREVLARYGAENVREAPGSDGTTELIHSCLLDRVSPHHSNADRNPSACVNVERRTFVCYSSGYGCDLLHLIALLEGKEVVLDALPVISSLMVPSVRPADELLRQIEKFFAEPATATLELPTYHERVLQPWGQYHPYLATRGITGHGAEVLRLGWDPQENRIVFPHFWNDKLVGWQKRAIPATPDWPGTVPDYPKFRSSIGFPKSETLYNYDTARRFRNVIVVESPMSVARARSLGVDNAVATFGAKTSDLQLAHLREFGTVWVWFDADSAGYAGERKVVSGLYRHCEVKVVTPDIARDLGDSRDADEIFAKLEAAVPAALRVPEYGEGRRHGRVHPEGSALRRDRPGRSAIG